MNTRSQSPSEGNSRSRYERSLPIAFLKELWCLHIICFSKNAHSKILSGGKRGAAAKFRPAPKFCQLPVCNICVSGHNRSRLGNHSFKVASIKKQAAHLDGLFRFLFQRSLLLFLSSGERSRTSTPVRTIDFESIASAIPPHRPVKHRSVATDQATDLVSIPT